MALQEEIDKTRAEIKTDSYSMSIGELISLYEKDEIDIHPEFQRYYRWTIGQKSKLIESIFLGIPIPPIYVAQRSDGIWDVVDGLQRLSTIYQFVGLLRDHERNLLPALTLEKTQYLPSLAGKKWEDPGDPNNSLTVPQRLLIKRSKLDVSIILKESDDLGKYELFQRLNTGGSSLSAQEVRNSIMVSINNSVYQWMRCLANEELFKECVVLTDRAIEEQYDMDLVLRFILLRKISKKEISKIKDINDFLDDQMRSSLFSNSINMDEETIAFNFTFSLLQEQLGNDSFRRFDPLKGKFVGGFSISAFEYVALGVGYNFKHNQYYNRNIREIAQLIWKDNSFINKTGSGVRASSRLPVTISLGRANFKP